MSRKAKRTRAVGAKAKSDSVTKAKPRKVARSAKSGRFVPKTFAASNPDTTVRENVLVKIRKHCSRIVGALRGKSR